MSVRLSTVGISNRIETMIYLQLFWVFFKIGLFGFGGGAAMLSMIQGEVVTTHHWLSTSEFADVVAISQSTPGPIGINTATYAGYTALINSGSSTSAAIFGSAIATISVVLPSFLLVMLVVKVLHRYREHSITKLIFSALRPTVVGLLIAAVLVMLTKDNFSSPKENPWQFWNSAFIFVFAFFGTVLMKIHPIKIICLCGVAGLLLYA